MFKKVLCLFATLILAISLVGCGQSTEEIKGEIDAVYDMVDEVNTRCEYLVAVTYEQWNSTFFDTLFDAQEYAKKKDYMNEKAQKTRETVDQFRNDANADLGRIKDMLKEITPNDETQDYYEAVEDLYVNVNTYYSFAADYPAGYSKISFVNEIMEHQEEYDELVSKVELEK